MTHSFPTRRSSGLTSDLRNDRCYHFFVTLPIEGLAWECLRRHIPYHKQYASLVDASAESLPLPREVQQHWGLRFRSKARSFRSGAAGGVVAISRPSHHLPDAPARLSDRKSTRLNSSH